MKKTILIYIIPCLLLLGLFGCSLINNPTPTDPPRITILTAEGDKENLPDFASQLEIIKIGDNPNADAIFISRGLFEKARSDDSIKSWLQGEVFNTILLIYGGDTIEVAQVLGLKSPTMIAQNSTYIIAVIRATEKVVIGGGILVPSGNNGDLSLKDLEDYITLVQKQVK